MKVLVITSIYPSSKEPTRGIYVHQLVVELARQCEIKVMAALPWSPKYGGWVFTQVPGRETIDGIDVLHPRYFVVPKIGRSLYGWYFYHSLRNEVRKFYETFRFDVLFVPWVYPDGFGSVLIAKDMEKPIVLMSLGSDINVSANYFLRGKLIARALRNSNRVISLSAAIKKKMMEVGIEDDQISVIPNGVDISLFKPMDRKACRQELGIPQDKKVISFIGNFLPVKGIEYLIDAFASIAADRPDVDLYLVGDGILDVELRTKVRRHQLENRVHFPGRQLHRRTPLWFNATDVFCLPSLNEGCPNVVLEAHACGRPVVASLVGGIPDIITHEDYGVLVEAKNVGQLATALDKALEKKWNYEAISIKGQARSWRQVASEVYDEFVKATMVWQVIECRRAPAPPK